MSDVLLMSPETCPDCKEGDTISVKLGPVSTMGDGSMVCEVSSATKGESEEPPEEAPETEPTGEESETPPSEKKGMNPLVMAVVGRKK